MDEVQIIPIKNFRINLTEYAELATNGQTFVVVKRSKPIFKVIPIKDNNNTKTTKDKKIKDFLSYAGLLSDIDEEKWIKNVRKNRKLKTRKLPSIS